MECPGHEVKAPTFLIVIIGHLPVSIERDTDLSALCGLEFFAIQLDSVRVRQDDIVPNTTTLEQVSNVQIMR